MSTDLLRYYNQELSFIRHLAAQFAEQHPKIAGRLRLGPEGSQDPHVERLIEAFAYLTARVRRKLDDEFPEITEALLGVLYPHYQAPIPSMAVVRFQLDPAQGELTAGHTLPRHTGLETEPIQGEPCRFRTCYPVTLWPFDLESATLGRPPFPAPATPRGGQAAAVLRLVLRCRSDTVGFGDLALGALREFFLKGQAQHVFPLYELLFNDTLEVALAEGPSDPAPAVLGPECLRPVGFERDEGLLPYTARSFLGYRLLSEYFTFPEKFLFLEIAGLTPRLLRRFRGRLEVYLYLRRAVPDLEQNLSADTFRLGCSPVVNLYPHRAEPIRLTHTDHEYHVVPDARRLPAHEIYAIDRVTASSPAGEQVEYQPFFSVKHAADARAVPAYWYASRQPADQAPGQTDQGTEIYLALVDLAFQPAAPANWTVDVEAICLNRDLPHRLPFGGDQPHLQLSEGGALATGIDCLTPPTRTFRPALKQGALWRLVSHLSLNHLSLVDDGDKADALREVLKLYDFADSAGTRKMIDGILRVGSRRVVGRTGSGPGAFCRGVEVTVHFDEERFTGSGLFLFASVLERFLALYSTVNSFTKMIATTNRREGELRRWPPRIGEKVLV